MNLEFPLLSGGPAQGLADAGIETFEGDYAHYVVRETIQNSLDAKSDSGEIVEVSFTHEQHGKSDFPFFPALQAALESTQKKEGGSIRGDRFFSEIEKQLSHQSFDVLRIRDSGTTGVAGGDNDDNSPWSALIQQRGATSKSNNTAAGSFGIGKDAPLAASAFRTILYSTLTEDGQNAFQGICRLATHLNSHGKKTQQTGFIGEPYNEEIEVHPAIRDIENIPESFRRATVGLTLWVLGFRYGGDSWEERFQVAAIENFWPAIHLGLLRIKIQQTMIDSTTLGTLIDSLADIPKIKEITPYYKAEVTPDKEFTINLPIAGECRLTLKSDSNYPRRIKMTRKSGMIIDEYRPRGSLIPFAGHFSCTSDKGNTILRILEPPAHDKWDKNRGETSDEKKIIDEIRAWIKECITQLNPEGHQTSFTEDQLSRHIPPIAPEDLPDTGTATGEKDLGGSPLELTFPKPNSQLPKITVKSEGEEGKNAEKGSGGEGEENEDGDEGDGENTGGRAGNQGDQGSGEEGKSSAFSRIKSFRAFASGSEGETYTLVFRGKTGEAVNIQIFTHSDDGRTTPLSLKSAVDASTGSPIRHSGNTLHSIVIPDGDLPIRLTITPTHSGSYSVGAKVS